MTLIELLVAIAVMAVLVAVAAPNFSDTIKRNRVQSQLRELVGTLAMARSEAVSRSRRVTVCASSDGATCTGGAWREGWLVFVDSGTEGSKDAGDQILKVHDGIGANSLKVIDNTNVTPASLNYVSFDRSGFTNQRITWSICDKDNDVSFARAVLMERTGSAVLSSVGANNIHMYLTYDRSLAELTCP